MARTWEEAADEYRKAELFLKSDEYRERWGVGYAELTIRESTEAERKEKWPPLIRGNPPIEIPKYVVTTVENKDKHMFICSVFGLPQGASTRTEAVFWAERFASKNGYDYVPPKGWEKIEGKLKEN